MEKSTYEKRSLNEEALLVKAVLNGQTAIAKMILFNLPLCSFRGEGGAVENVKRYSNNMNRLLCEIVKNVDLEQSEHLYSVIKLRIDNLQRSDDVFVLWSEIMEKYCMIVNNQKAKSFSPTVQRVIVSVNNDITVDLKLNAIAEHLNMNASYLSNLFHKETGMTITAYVNQKRLEYAEFLLVNTNLNISTIAQECGVYDENYFARLFKKWYRLSPTQYRKQKLS